MTYTCQACGKTADLPAGTSLCPSCGAAAAATSFEASTHPYPPGAAPLLPEDLLRPGESVNGYVIDRMIGRGGMGEVYLAVQQSLGRKVALKILAERFSKDPAFVERFSREAAALANLSHPNIVSIIDKGVWKGRYFFIMEYVDGVNLRKILHQGKLSPEEALKMVPMLCDALAYAHERGIIHRDVKPENILFTKSGQPKIADFGLARLMQSDKPAEFPAITQSGTVMGTSDYMAPEARRSAKQADHRADIYSLGVVLYEMLTGELPLGKFAPPSRKVQVDVRLDEVVLKTLEADPELRYQKASEVGRDVTQITETGRTGRAAGIPASQAPPAPKRLVRRREGKILGGVCGGIADRYGWDPIWARLAFLLTTLLWGGGIVAYFFLWLAMPKEEEPERKTHNASLHFLLCCILVIFAGPILIALFGGSGWSFLLWYFLPAAVILLAALLFGTLVKRVAGAWPGWLLGIVAIATVIVVSAAILMKFTVWRRHLIWTSAPLEPVRTIERVVR